MKKTSLFLSLLLLSMLASCSHAPEFVTYVLPNPAVPSTHATDSAAAITVSEIHLADYLNQSGFVIKTGEVEISVTHQHRWGESLDKGIERYLNRALEHQAVVSSGETSNDGSDVKALKLDLVFDAFESIDFHSVIASGSWSLTQGNDKNPICTSTFNYKLAIDPQNYTGIVKGFAEILDQLAKDIYANMEKSSVE